MAAPGTAPTPPPAPRRGPGHRGADVRDTVAEMAARAQEISQEAGSKMASALKDVINAAAGLASFAVESARDLVQYMVRRGQMTQEEADKLIREAEEAHARRGGVPTPSTETLKAEQRKAEAAAKKAAASAASAAAHAQAHAQAHAHVHAPAAHAPAPHHAPAAHHPPAHHPPAHHPPAAPAAAAPAAKSSAGAAPAKKAAPTAKSPAKAGRPPAAKSATKTSGKSAAKKSPPKKR